MSSAEVNVLEQGIARDNREAAHRHQLATAAASHAGSTANVQIAPVGETLKTIEMIMRFIEHTSTTEHVGLTVVRCVTIGCNAFCCALAPRFSADALPVCGFHDVNRDAYHAPSGLTKTRRIIWLMYNGLFDHGPCWLCRVDVSLVNFEAAHITPRSISRNDSVANLRP